VGGTYGDLLFYNSSIKTSTSDSNSNNKSNGNVQFPVPPKFSGTLTPYSLLAVYKFAQSIKADLVLGVNAGTGTRQAAIQGNGNGHCNSKVDQPYSTEISAEISAPWHSFQLESLLHSAVNELNITIAALEFGNEPNLFAFFFGVSNFTSAKQYAKDFNKFAQVVNDFYKTKASGKATPLLVGPDVALHMPLLGEVIPFFMEEFIAGARENLDIVTYHYYPLQSQRCPVRV